MWLLILSFVFACPLIEMVEGWLLRRSALKQLAEMRNHSVSGMSLAVNGRHGGSPF